MARERIVFHQVKDEQTQKRTLQEMARRIREIEKELFGEDKGLFPCEEESAQEGA